MADITKDDMKELLDKLAIALGEQVTEVTTHIEKLFPPTELSQWMDNVGNHMGGWYHRVKHGHDFFANGELVYKKFGVKGLITYPFELGKDSLTHDGIPLPGTQTLHEQGFVGAKNATEWMSVNIGDVLVGALSVYTTYRLYKRTKEGQLSKRQVFWATVGCITKVSGGIVSHQPVVILSGLSDGFIILDNQFDIRSRLSEALGVDVNEILGRALKATAAGAVVGGLAATGAFSATAAFATASTGTAIASLSGVAATNATLAALGGGALSAGGLGMLGGAMVLSGGTAIVAIGAGTAVWYYFKPKPTI